MPKKQPKRGRLWLNDGSCIRLRPEHRNHVWSYDFVVDRTHDGRPLRMLTVIDEYTRECLAIDVRAQAELARTCSTCWRSSSSSAASPAYIRSDNGPEFTAKAVREWLARLGVKTLFIEPGSPWENGYNERFNGKLRDELLERRDLLHAEEAQVLIERWRREYNHVRPHSSLGYRPPAPEAREPAEAVSATLRPPRLVPIGSGSTT